MGAFILFFLVLLAVFVEIFGPKYFLKSLFYKSEVDKYLIEPEEEVVLYQRLINQSRLPILYVNLISIMHPNTNFLEDDDWCKNHVSKSSFEPSCKYRMYLSGWSERKTKIRFSINKRGCYQFGHYYIEAGDLFGLRSEVSSREQIQEIVVIPGKTNSDSVWKAYSGFIGDISVQRFILEDPVLTVGFREYTGHEPMKSISFTQTARLGKMYVKSYDHTAELNVTVLLNMCGGTEDELEECLRITRTICEDLEKRHISYGFASNGDVADYIAPGLGNYHYNILMKLMGKSKLVTHYSLELLLNKCLNDQAKSRGFILITPPLDEYNKNIVQQFNQRIDSELCVLVGGEEA